MKTYRKFIPAALATALFATSAFASDPQLRVIDNHHGTYTYVSRPGQPRQTETTFAFGGHTSKAEKMGASVKQLDTKPTGATRGFHEVSTPHGTVSYFTPAE